MRDQDVEAILSEKAGLPEAANNRLKALRRVFAWARKPHKIERDPTAGVEFRESKNPDGFYSWSVPEVRQYEARHPIGTKARLALALLLYTGVRRSDVVRLGPQMERNGALHFTERKGSAHEPKHRAVDILPQLREVIDATPSGNLNFPGDAVRPALHGQRLRRVVQAPLPRGRTRALLCPWAPQGRGDHRSRERRDRTRVDGDLRVDQPAPGGGLHQEGEP